MTRLMVKLLREAWKENRDLRRKVRDMKNELALLVERLEKE